MKHSIIKNSSTVTLILISSFSIWSCSKGSISSSSATLKTAVQSNAPTNDDSSASKTLDKDNNIWTSDYKELNGFAVEIPPSELSSKNLLVTAKLKGDSPNFSLLVTGDRPLSNPFTVTLPKAMQETINGLSMNQIQVVLTPTDAKGNVTGKDIILSSSNYGKIGNSIIMNLDSWGVIKVGKIPASQTPAPTAVNIVSLAPTVASGGYKAGDTITIAMNFSEAVTVTGTPTLNLNFGAPAKASYSAGSGSTALIFSYTIANGDNISPLEYASTSALNLEGGSIKNAAGTSATLTLPAPGATGSLSATTVIAVDTTPPSAPSLTGATLTNSTQPTISWTSGGSGNGTYRYKMDSSDLNTGTTTISSTSMTPSTPLTDGAHTLYVQERDAAGNWSAAGNFAFTIDTNMPGAPVVTSSVSTTANDQPTWTWTSGGNGGSGYRYKLDNNTMTSGTTATTLTTFTPSSALSEGAHTLYVQEVNSNGSWSPIGSYVVTVDTLPPTAPSVTSTASLTTNTQPTWTWTAGGGGNGQYRVKLDNSTMTAGTTALSVATFTPASALADGAHVLYVQERDAAGNWSATGSYSVTVDSDPPTAPTVSGTAAVNILKPTWSWSAGTGGNGTFRYKLGSSDLTTGATTTTATTYTAASDLTEAGHTLYVQERDAAGNWSPSGSFTTTVDIQPPTVDAGTNLSTSAQFTRTATVTGATTYQWSKTSGPGTVTFGSATAASTTISANTTGSYVVRLTATDAANNTAYSEFTLSWTNNDGIAPGVPTLDITSKVFNSNFTVTATQNATTDADFTEFRYTTTGTAPTSCSDGTATSGAITISATTTLKVVACDAGGNISTTAATGTYTLDTTNPSVPSLDISTKVFNSNFTVTATQNATADTNFVDFRYTTTGTAPASCSAGTSTSGAISITGTSNVTLKLIACDTAGNASPVVTGAYVYNNSTPLVPSLDISSKVFNSNFNVAVSENATPDAGFLEFRYTTTGVAPTGCSDGTASSGTIAITGTSNVTLKVITCNSVGNASPVVTGTYTYDNTAPLTPTLSVSSKAFNSDFTVTATQNATTDTNFTEFRYTTTGVAPANCAAGTATSGSISITGTSNVTLKVIACDAAGNASAAAVTGSYTFDNTAPLTPSIDISSKVFGSTFTVTATQNATTDANFLEFRYTTTGTAPASCSAGTASSGAISITGTSNVTLKVIACDSAGNASAAVTGTYTYSNSTPLVPSLDISSKVFNSNFTVTVSQNATPDADFTEFRYTTTGTAPTSCSNGTASSGSISITGTSSVTLKVIACNAIGNYSPVATGTYTYDNTAPLTPSLSLASKVFNADFTITASQNASTDANFTEFRYTTTGTAPADCSSGTASSGSISITGTSDVTLKVIACDAAGNKSSAVTGTYTYDNTAPLTPSIDITTKTFASSFTVTATQNATTDANFLEFRYTTTGTAPASCAAGTASSGSISISGTSNVTLKVIACDAAGNASSAVTGTYTYDGTAPLTPSLSLASKVFNADFTVTASQNATTDANFLEFRYTTTGTAPASCAAGTASSGSISITGTSSVTLKVIACDSAGNASSAVTGTYTYDNTAPLTPSLNYTTKYFGSNFTVTASQNATTDANFTDFRYTTTGVAPADCSSGTTSSGSISITGTSNVTLKVIACDGAGNASSAVTGTYTYDGTAPLTPSLDITTKSFNSDFTVTASQNATTDANFADFRYTTTGTAPADCSSGTTSSGSISITGTSNVTLKVIACDSAGNASPVVTGTYTYDNTPPTSPTISISSGATYTTSSSITLGLSAVGATEMYVTNTSGCGSGGNYEAYATTKVWTLGQSNGTATVYVKYKDAAGNETSCINDTIVHDGTNPTAPSSINDGTTNIGLTSSPTITWTASTDTGGSGISYYEIAIGTSAGGTDVKTWTSTGSTSTSGQATGLTLTAGTTYYASVRAVDAAGNTSSVGQGDGWVPSASLSCPTNYVPIAANAALGTAAFCVMKYEAKIVGQSNGNKTYSAAYVAESRPDGTPWVSIKRTDAITECQSLSYAGSDMISNIQWQAMGRDIELAQSGGAYLNWSNGSTSGANAINRGNSNNTGSAYAAGADDAPCTGLTTTNCADNTHTDFRFKRTHTLSSGDIIWDVAGNVSEWVKDNYTNQGSQVFVSQLSAALSVNWGAGGSYSAKNSGEYGGLGNASIAGTGGAVVRGGYHTGTTNVGIYYSYFAYNNTTTNQTFVGFRCISTGP